MWQALDGHQSGPCRPLDAESIPESAPRQIVSAIKKSLSSIDRRLRIARTGLDIETRPFKRVIRGLDRETPHKRHRQRNTEHRNAGLDATAHSDERIETQRIEAEGGMSC